MPSKINIVDLTVEGLGPGVLVSGVTVTQKLNDFAECSLSVGFKSDEGIKSLKALFPTVSMPRAARTIIVRARVGDYNCLLFRGQVVGFGKQITSGGISYNLNVRSGFQSLAETLVSVPGFAPENSVSLDLDSLTSSLDGLEDKLSEKGKTGDLFSSVLSVFNTMKELYSSATLKLYTHKETAAVWKTVTGTTGKGSELLNKIVPVSLNSQFIKDNESSIVSQMAELALESDVTFWKFLQVVAYLYKCNFIDTGTKLIMSPSVPLTSPCRVISEKDMESLTAQDMPFSNVTRAIVKYAVPAGTSLEGLQGKGLGVYPSQGTTSVQEGYSGARTVMQDLNITDQMFISSMVDKEGKDLELLESALKKLEISKNKRDEILQVQEDKKEEVKEKYLDIMAQALYMSELFKQRTGALGVRYMPEIVPGIVVRIEDPLDITSFYGYVVGVTHTINYDSATAGTHITLNNIRYPGELSGPVANPLFPGVTSSTVWNAAKIV